MTFFSEGNLALLPALLFVLQAICSRTLTKRLCISAEPHSSRASRTQKTTGRGFVREAAKTRNVPLVCDQRDVSPSG